MKKANDDSLRCNDTNTKLLCDFIKKVVDLKSPVLSLDAAFGNSSLGALRLSFFLAYNYPFLCILPTFGGGHFKIAICSKVNICRFYPSCSRRCGRLHICKNYLNPDAETCKFGSKCWFEHNIFSEYNRCVLQKMGLDVIPAGLLKKLIVLCCDESTQMLSLCSEGNCPLNCQKLHVCFFHLVKNQCRYNDACAFGHNIHTKSNKMTLRRLNLEDVPEEELRRYICLLYDEACEEPRFHNFILVMLLNEERVNVHYPTYSTIDAWRQHMEHMKANPPLPRPVHCTHKLNEHWDYKNNESKVFKIVDVDSGKEFEAIKFLFEQTMADLGLLIGIKRIQNMPLFKQFHGRLETHAIKRKEIKQLWTFYGIRKENLLTSAYENVLNPRTFNNDLETTSKSQGYFFMAHARDAHPFTRQDENSIRYMFVIRIINTEEPGEKFDDMIVVPVVDSSSCYPEYIIKYSDY